MLFPPNFDNVGKGTSHPPENGGTLLHDLPFHDTPYHEAALHTTRQKVVPPPVLEFTIPQIAVFCATIAVVRGNFFTYHASIEVSERNED
jgi:hypothetical protein